MDMQIPDAGRLSILLLFGGPFAVAGLYIVVQGLTGMVRQWRETSLKSRMIELGMSAEEIERVINAGRGDPPPAGPPSTAKPAKPGGQYAWQK